MDGCVDVRVGISVHECVDTVTGALLLGVEALVLHEDKEATETVGSG